MDNNTKYCAKIILMARDGRVSHPRAVDVILNNGLHHSVQDELFDWLHLSMKMNIYVESDDYDKLMELSEKYEIPEVINYEVW